MLSSEATGRFKEARVNVDNEPITRISRLEWGLPAHDDRNHFDPKKVARYTDARIEKLTADAASSATG